MTAETPVFPLDVPVPPLRHLTAEITLVQGERYAVLSDAEGLTEKRLMISPDMLDLLSLFDGTRSIRDICLLFREQFSPDALGTLLGKLAHQLDQCLLLESEKFDEFKRQREAQFVASTVRPLRSVKTYGPPEQRLATFSAILGMPVLLGRDALLAPRELSAAGCLPAAAVGERAIGVPACTTGLRRRTIHRPTAGYVELTDSSESAILGHDPVAVAAMPVNMPGSSAASHQLDPAESPMGSAAGSPSGGSLPIGLIVPHLEFERAIACYHAGYAALPRQVPLPAAQAHIAGDGGSAAVDADRPPQLRVVVLGTNHSGSYRDQCVATDKAFETFNGLISADSAFLDRLDQQLRFSLRSGQVDHLAEMSIELQAVLLAHRYGPQPVVIVPILVPDPTNSGHPGPSSIELGEAIAAVCADDPLPTVIMASADFSHVGSYFDPRHPDIDDAFCERVEQADRAVFEFITDMDLPGLVDHQKSTGNWSYMCSIGCVSALMAACRLLAPRRSTRLLAYHQSVRPEINNLVSCCTWRIDRRS